MLKTKQNIAVFISALAMLALLLHGILPHHHHDSDTEVCREELATCDHHHSSNAATDAGFEQTNCCESHDSAPTHNHACSLNVTASKHVSVTIFASIKYISFNPLTQGCITFVIPDSDHFLASNFPDSHSLRGPPLA